MVEPVLRPIRNRMPNFGAIDLSPIILLLACFFLQGLIHRVLIPALATTVG
jgi:YggT family protein